MNELIPDENESFERYTIRAHRLLMDRIPDPMDRNAKIRELWEQYRGPSAPYRVALKEFSPEKYDHHPDVVVFAEHETTDSRGKPRKYSLRELAKIVRNNNSLIEDVNAFPALSDGHTSDPNDPVQAEAELLGFSGPFRLGMIGRVNPRWAILQDEFHRRDKAERLADLPRRSPELWTFHDTGKMQFDPVACLGSEKPRLPMPVRFQEMSRSGVSLERYSAVAPSASYPAGGNTFVKSHDDYQEGESPMGQVSPDITAEIVAAIAELPVFQWAKSKMEAETSQRSESGGDKENFEEDGGDDPSMPNHKPEMGNSDADDDIGDLNDLLSDDDEREDFACMPGKPSPKKPSMYSEKAGKGNAGLVTVEKYNQLATSHQKLLRTTRATVKELDRMRRNEHDLKRSDAIRELANQFPHVVDYDEEATRCLYSQGGKMTDAEFDAHIATVEKYASRTATPMIPRGEFPEVDRGGSANMAREAYAEAVHRRALQIATDAANTGSPITYGEAEVKAKEQLKR